MAAAAALFVSSCAKEVLPSEAAGSEATVSFTIALEDVVDTRATTHGNGLQCDYLVYEVYDANGLRIDDLSGEIENAFQTTAKKETVTVQLAKGQTYSFAFWAQVKACGAYDATDLQNIKISYDYEGAEGNDENRDAFFGNTEEITVTGNFDRDIQLKRPFAQLNLGVSDIEAALAAGIKLEQVKVVVSDVAGILDAKTGAVSGSLSDVEFPLAEILYKYREENEARENNEILELKNPVKVLVNGVETDVKEFPWISMNYLLVNNQANAAASSAADVKFTLDTDKADIELLSSNTPLQRNYRTNIIAKLTSTGTFNIEIVPIFDGEADVEIGSDGEKEEKVYPVKAGENFYENLVAAVKAGETNIQLTDGTYDLIMHDNTNARTLNITGTSENAVINLKKDQQAFLPKYTLNFSNVTIVSEDVDFVSLAAAEATYTDCVFEKNFFCYTSKTTFNNCTFNTDNAERYNVWTYGSLDTDFNNCTFNCAGKSVLVYGDNTLVWKDVNFKDCEFNATTPVTGKAAIEIDATRGMFNVYIEGCTATGFANGSVSKNSLYNPKAGTEGTEYTLVVTLAEGVKLVKGNYEISSANGMFWFADQVNNQKNNFSGKTVAITAAVIDLQGKLWEPVGQTNGGKAFVGTFEGNGNTIKNLRVDTEYTYNQYTAAGLFGWLNGTVQNVNVEGAKISGTAYVGTIAGYLEGAAKIDGCDVTGATVSGHYLKNDNEGDKVGGIAGYVGNAGTLVNNCTIKNSAIDAVRDAGQIAGAAIPANITDCSADEVTVEHNDSAPAGYGKDGWRIAERQIGYDTTRPGTENY